MGKSLIVNQKWGENAGGGSAGRVVHDQPVPHMFGRSWTNRL